MASFRMVATDRTASCKGCGVNIVWRVGVIRPLLLANGEEHICAKYRATSGKRFWGSRRVAGTLATAAPDGEVAVGTVLKRGGKRIACKTCGTEGLEWIQVATDNGAKWYYAPFGTEDISGTIHANRPEACQSTVGGVATYAAPVAKSPTRRRAVKAAPLSGAAAYAAKPATIERVTMDCIEYAITDTRELRCTAHGNAPGCTFCSKPTPNVFAITYATADGKVVTVTNVISMDVEMSNRG